MSVFHFSFFLIAPRALQRFLALLRDLFPIDEIGKDGVVVGVLDGAIDLAAVGLQVGRGQHVVDAEEHLVAVVAEAEAVAALRVGILQQTRNAIV